MSRLGFVVCVVSLLASGALAQSHQPYAGMQTRPIKALSDQQIADLKAGRGMGLALAAELNSYPGPIHVLELAQPLGLTPAQRSRMEELFSAMKAEAVALGDTLLAHEMELDRQFATRTVTAQSLDEVTRLIGATQAGLRATHLKYHLLTRDLLTSAQLQRYAELRGYTAGHPPAHPHRGHH